MNDCDVFTCMSVYHTSTTHNTSHSFIEYVMTMYHTSTTHNDTLYEWMWRIYMYECVTYLNDTQRHTLWMNVTYSHVWVCNISQRHNIYEWLWRIYVYGCVVDTQSSDSFTASIIMHHTMKECGVFTRMSVSLTRNHLTHLLYEWLWPALWMSLMYSHIWLCRRHAVMASICFIYYMNNHDSHYEWLWLIHV